MLALDIDGTLVGTNGIISDQTKESISAARKKDIKVILISGREAYSINMFAKQLNLNELIISLNGAMVTDNEFKKVVFRTDIQSEITQNIIKSCKVKNISMILFSGNELFTNEENENLELFKKYSHAPVNIVGDLSNFHKEHMVGKVLIIGNHEVLLDIKGNLDQSYSKEVNIEFSKPFFLEVYNSKTSKGIMLEKIANYYEIESKEIMAIGDGENDISMIEYAGMGVAMGNALENVKGKANFVTLSQSENGVGYAIEKILL